MNLMCKLGFHRWVRVGITKPIRRQSDFVKREYIGHKAMGRCDKCGAKELKNVTGWWRWYNSEEVTEAEYREKFDSGEYQF